MCKFSFDVLRIVLSECVYTAICQSAVSPSYLHQPQAGTTWECLEKMLKSKCLTFFITNYFNKNCSTSIQCHKNINRKLFNLLLKELQRTVTVSILRPCCVRCTARCSDYPEILVQDWRHLINELVVWLTGAGCSVARRVTYEPSRSARRRTL